MSQINDVNRVELGFTSNATQQTIFSYEVKENTSGYFKLNVLARKVSNGATKAWSMDGVFKRNTGNATVSVELLGLVGSSGDLIELLLASATMDTSGADVRVRISGLLSTDIDWYGEMIGKELQIN